MEHILDTGIDIVEMDAVRAIRFPARFAEYFLTKDEILMMPADEKRAAFLASRFALKEAVIKAVPEKLRPHDFEIQKDGPRPVVVFCDQALRERYRVSVSLTHTKHIAAAIAIVIRME